MTNLHQLAAINKYRFPSQKGNIALEDLYSLPIESRSTNVVTLSSVFAILAKQRNEANNTSLLGNSKNQELENKIELIQEVLAYKQAQAKREAERKENIQKAAVLLEAAEVQEINELVEGQSAKELRKKAKKLMKA